MAEIDLQDELWLMFAGSQDGCSHTGFCRWVEKVRPAPWEQTLKELESGDLGNLVRDVCEELRSYLDTPQAIAAEEVEEWLSERAFSLLEVMEVWLDEEAADD